MDHRTEIIREIIATTEAMTTLAKRLTEAQTPECAAKVAEVMGARAELLGWVDHLSTGGTL